MEEKVCISIELETLEVIVRNMKNALAPMVPYRRDALEFCEAAHDVKDEHIRLALALLLPLEIVENMED